MAQAQAAVLEFGQGAVIGARRVAVSGIGKLRLVAQHLQHLHRVVFPVGGAMDVAARRNAAGQERDERGLDQAALVMALLGPRIREIDMHAGQRVGGDHVAHHFHRVVLDDAQVRDAGVLDATQQRADAGVEHLHAQEVVVRTRQRDLLGGLAHAEADLQHRRGLPAEGGGGIQAARRIGNGPLAHQALERGQLALRNVAAAVHETADMGCARAVGSVRGTGQRRLRFRGNGGGRSLAAGRGGGACGSRGRGGCGVVVGGVRIHSPDCSGRSGAPLSPRCTKLGTYL